MDLSIIIPCFNHGLYIDEALESIKTISGIKYEVIIVNDGSTDSFTLKKLGEIKLKGITVISQQNSGPAVSRNVGIKFSTGKYILPLDADNKLKAEYVHRGIEILRKGRFDIVYGNPIFFGEKIPSREFKVKPFNGVDLFIYNYIDTCAIFKRDVWENIGGYDPNIPFHQEDWEFWLHAYIKDFRFCHIDKGLYYYRILEDSVASKLGADNDNLNQEYILKKHFNAFTKTMIANYTFGKMYQRDLQHPLRASLKFLLHLFKPSKR